MATTATLPTATVDDLLCWGPCADWPAAKIRRLAAGRGRWTALDVLALDAVPIDDRLWVVLRPELLPGRVARLWACWCARSTPLPDGRTTWDLLGDPRSRAAIEAAERFARGEATAEELAAAWFAAWAAARAAAWDAAWFAARAAARAAACDAAWDAAWDAARDAARAAAWDAAWAAAWAAARAAQVGALRRHLEAEGR
jgi:hypothetical protein